MLPGYYVEICERVYFEQPRDVIYPDATLDRRRPDDEAWTDPLLRNTALRGQSSGGDSGAPGA